jgi:outer membrane protein assembly factor BamB
LDYIPEPAFEIIFTGTIWRVTSDPAANLLVAELRDGAESLRTFAAVDTFAGKCLWESPLVSEYPWLTAVAVHQGILYLQALSGGQPPQPLAVMAVDVATRQVRWQQPKSSWHGVIDGGVVIMEMGYDGFRYFTLDPQDGKVVQEGPDANIQLWERPDSKGTVWPVHHPEGSPYASDIARFIENKLGVKPVRAFDYAQKKDVVVISYYLYHGGKYENYLALFDHNGHLRWQQRIAGGLPGAGVNTFFIVENLLIFVREKNQLLGYVL